MATVTAGASHTETLSSRSTITISSIDGAERANIVVLRAGAQVFGDRVSNGASVGPFEAGDVLLISAEGGSIDYTVTAFQSSVSGGVSPLIGGPAESGRPLKAAVFAGDKMPTAFVPGPWSTSGTVNGTFTAAADDAEHGKVLQINVTNVGTKFSVIRQFGQQFKGGGKGGLSFYIKRDANLSVLDIEIFAGDYVFNKRTSLNKGVSAMDAGKYIRFVIPLSEAESWNGGITPADGAIITGIRIGATAAAGQITTLLCTDLAWHDVHPGTVSFHFDDARLDTYTVAYPILASAGYIGSVAAEWHRFGYDGTYKIMSEAQMLEMYAAGWVITGHHHDQFALLTVANQITRHQGNKAWMHAKGITRGSDIFVWPGGSRSDETEEVASRYWRVTRRVSQPCLVGINGVYDTIMPAHTYWQAAKSIASIKASIDKVKEYGGSLVLTLHSLVDVEVAPEDVTTSKFVEIVNYVKAAGVPVVGLDAVWNSI